MNNNDQMIDAVLTQGDVQPIYDKYSVKFEKKLEDYANLVAIYNEAVRTYGDKPAYSCLGHTISYNEFDRLSAAFASYLHHHTDLEKGDRVAVMLPNILQQPIAAFGILRAGMVLVNTNPLYTERELEHQINDSGAKAIVVLANMAHVVEDVVPDTPSVKHIIKTEVADLHPSFKRFLINSVIKYVKRDVPKYNLPQAVPFRDVIAEGSKNAAQPVVLERDDIAVLQYTGGTTGLSKGAKLSHANLIANCVQVEPFMHSFGLERATETIIQPLPLYHIYAFTMTLAMLALGSHNVLVPNPRDLPSLVKEFKKQQPSVFCGLNTLFVAMLNNADFQALDFSALKLTVSGGMALTQDTAEQWKKITKATISEGYGLTEASPVVSFNPGGGERIGSVGIPLPLTEMKLIDDNGELAPNGERGELCVKGPQVMLGYWNNDEATNKTIVDGWLLTGDVAIFSEDGYVSIVDRKKDLIIVSGFNVYPNEVEDQLSLHPDIIEVAAVGEPDKVKGEVVKVFVVKRPDSALDKDDVLDFARENLTGYKIPKLVEFRDELPKSNVGKILRRKLREENA